MKFRARHKDDRANEQANGPVIPIYMSPEEILEKYGPITPYKGDHKKPITWNAQKYYSQAHERVMGE